MRAYKFRLYPNKVQQSELQLHLHWAKDIWNEMLNTTKQKYENEKKFSNINELNEIVKLSEYGLYSQVSQDIFKRLNKSIHGMTARKKKGLNAGFPRFKSIDRVKSLTYPQHGFSLNEKKLKVTPFGEINIKKHREIDGKIKMLTLKRESSGKWYAILITETELKSTPNNNGIRVGIDLGLINFAMLSDGTAIKNPKHLKKYEERLKKKQQKLSYKDKGSKNRIKAKGRLSILHETVRNTRKDFLHKLSTKLVHSHSFIALEDLKSQKMSEEGHGKSINDAGWGIFTNMLSYKAEDAGCEVVFVNPKNTSKECNNCGTIVKKDLWERQHNCPNCSLSIDRDLNAAINILNRATVGITGSNACRDETIVSSMKQEAHDFNHG